MSDYIHLKELRVENFLRESDGEKAKCRVCDNVHCREQNTLKPYYNGHREKYMTKINRIFPYFFVFFGSQTYLTGRVDLIIVMSEINHDSVVFLALTSLLLDTPGARD